MSHSLKSLHLPTISFWLNYSTDSVCLVFLSHFHIIYKYYACLFLAKKLPLFAITALIAQKERNDINEQKKQHELMFSYIFFSIDLEQ